MADLDILYTETKKYIESLETTYISKHINTPSGPSDYSNDVKSYCVLSHAAFEEFVETVALTAMQDGIDSFVYRRTLTPAVVALLHFKSNGDSHLSRQDDDSKIEHITQFDYIRKKLNEEIKDRFSSEIFHNHGVSLKYLNQLLKPVGIDLPTNPTYLDALKKLAGARGSYAHKFTEKGAVKTSISPEQSKTFVGDCLLMCEEIKNRAKNNFGSPNIHSKMNLKWWEKIPFLVSLRNRFY